MCVCVCARARSRVILCWALGQAGLFDKAQEKGFSVIPTTNVVKSNLNSNMITRQSSTQNEWFGLTNYNDYYY